LRYCGSISGTVNDRSIYDRYMADFYAAEALLATNQTHSNDATPDATHQNKNNAGSQPAFNDHIPKPNTDEDEVIPSSQEETFDHPGDSNFNLDACKTPPKKQKVSRAGGSIPTFAAPHYTSVSDRRHVVFAIPPLASKINALAFLHLFRPGFGYGHITICQYTPFPDCNCILVECADSEVSNELQEFLRNTAFFGKYQCAFATLTRAWEFDEIDNEVDPDPVMEKLL
jgi:hypothetical protein